MNEDCATGDGKIVNEGGVYCHDCAERIGRAIRRLKRTDWRF